MSRTTALYAVILAAVIIISTVWVTRFRSSREAPCPNCNIIIISIDSLRSSSLPCYGYLVPTAPVLCEFAKNNILFTRAYANSNWTRPSNISILTSLYPQSHGIIDPVTNTLNPTIESLPRYLTKHGYTTRFVTNDQYNIAPELGYSQIFQHVRLTPETFVQSSLDAWLETLDLIKSDNNHGKRSFVFFHTDHVHEYTQKLLGTKKIFPLDPTYAAPLLPQLRRFTNETWSFMREYLVKSRDYYRVQNIIDQHTAWITNLNQATTMDQARKVFENLPEVMQDDIYWSIAEPKLGTEYFDLAAPLYRHLYDEQIRTLDIVFDRLFERLRQNKLTDNTVIVITADHGQLLGEHGLLGHIVSMAKEEIHVPLIIRVPGAPNSTLDALTQNIDIYPTVVDLVGLPIPKKTQGISLAGLILGKANAQKNSFVISHTTQPNVMTSIITDQWRLMEANYPNGTYRELYDELNDPKERKSIASENQPVVDNLTKLLHEKIDSLPLYLPMQSTFPEWSEQNTRINAFGDTN